MIKENEYENEYRKEIEKIISYYLFNFYVKENII